MMVVVKLDLANGLGTLADIGDLEDQLVAALRESGAGALDGTEVEEGLYTFFLEGRSVERIREAIQDCVLSARRLFTIDVCVCD